MTKFQMNLLDKYEQAKYHTLYEAYGRPSNKKVSAYNACLQKMKEKNGWGARIPAINTCLFSFAFLFADPDTGEVMLHYETANNVYEFSTSTKA